MEWHLLQGVPAGEVRELLSLARRRRFRRGEVVFHRDDPADSMHLVVAGRFAVRAATPLGETATIAVRGPGDSFGELALLGERAGRRTATVAALEDAETFCVAESDFRRLRGRYAGIDRMLTDFLVGELRMLHERLLEALYLPAERRVLRRLLELAGTYADGSAAEVPLTQDELASLAGTSRATVNRVLREEERRGTVELGRGRTVVREPAEIARRAR